MGKHANKRPRTEPGHSWQTIADVAASLLLADRVQQTDPHAITTDRMTAMTRLIAHAQRRGVCPCRDNYGPMAREVLRGRRRTPPAHLN